jgi:acetyltransferase-like isoleucine patch superfamily enzyme
VTPAHVLSHDWFGRPLPDNVSIGEGSWLHSVYALLHNRSRRACALRIGRNSGIYRGSFFDLGPQGEVEIGDFCTLVSVIISSNARVLIGSYSFLAHEVVIADHFAAAPWSRDADAAASGPEPEAAVILGEDVWIGARATLLKGARIGSGAVIGAATVVDFEVPPGAIVAGDPARIVGSTGAIRS